MLRNDDEPQAFRLDTVQPLGIPQVELWGMGSHWYCNCDIVGSRDRRICSPNMGPFAGKADCMSAIYQWIGDQLRAYKAQQVLEESRQ